MSFTLINYLPKKITVFTKLLLLNCTLYKESWPNSNKIKLSSPSTIYYVELLFMKIKFVNFISINKLLLLIMLAVPSKQS